MLPETLPELMTPAALALLGIALILERIQAWQEATPETKKLATGLIIAAFTVLVTLYENLVPANAQVQLGEAYILLRPFFEHLLSSIGVMTLALEGGHRLLNKWVPAWLDGRVVHAELLEVQVADAPAPPAPLAPAPVVASVPPARVDYPFDNPPAG